MWDKLLIWLYDKLHERFHWRTMGWHQIIAGISNDKENRVVKLRVYGPKKMHMTDVIFVECPGKVKWYKMKEEDEDDKTV